VTNDDWQTLFQFIEMLGILATGVWTITVAERGLGTWKQQLHGEKKYEMCHNFRKALIRLRNAINDARRPFAPSEFPQGKFPTGQAQVENRKKLWRDAYAARTEPMAKARAVFQEQIDDGEAVWRDLLDADVQLMSRLYNQLVGQINVFIEGGADADDPAKDKTYPIRLAPEDRNQQDSFGGNIIGVIDVINAKLDRYLDQQDDSRKK